MNFKSSTRGKLIAAIALLAILSAVFYYMQRGRANAPLNEDQAAPRPINPLKEGIGNQRDADAASQLSAGARTPQPNEQRTAGQSERSSAVIPTNGFIMQMRLIHKVLPAYPSIAKSTGIYEFVELEVTTDKNGAVTKVNVIRGNPLFAEAAVEAVRQWRYEPVLINGISTPSSFTVGIHFEPEAIVHDSESMSSEPTGTNYVRFITNNPSDTSIRADPEFIIPRILDYDDSQYYSVTSDMSAPVIQIDKSRIREIVNASTPNDNRLRDLLTQPISYNIYIDETGNIKGVESIGVRKIPALEIELDKLHVQSPASYNGKPIQSYITLTIDP